MWTFLLSISTAFAYNNLSTYIDTPISDIVFLLDGKEITHNNLYHQKGETLDLYDIRQELEQLYATNRYKSIDISIEPVWSTEIKGHLDEPSSQRNLLSQPESSVDLLLQAPKLEGILLVYILESADSVVDIEIEGVRGRYKNLALQKLSLRVGETLPDDLGIRAKEIQRALRSSGWPRAKVKIFTETIQQKEFKIYVDVEKGYRRRIGRIKLVRAPKELQSKIRRKLRRKKIFVSATLTIDKLQTAKDDILDILYEEGYLNARVQILTDTGNNTSQVEIICETGPKTIFDLSTLLSLLSIF